MAVEPKRLPHVPPFGNLFLKGTGERNRVHPSDLVQGGHYDCFLLAGVAALVGANGSADEWMSEVIKPQPDGSFLVTLYVKDKYDPAMIKLVPTTVSVRGEDLKDAARSDDGDELWPAILEKAYSEVHKGSKVDDSYGMDGGTPLGAMESLTGVHGRFLDLPKTTIGELADYQRRGHAIAVGTYSKDAVLTPGSPQFTIPEYKAGGLALHNGGSPFQQPGGMPGGPPVHGHNSELRGNHAYYVTKVDAAKGMVTIHNPWDEGRQDIQIPYDRFQVVFENLQVHPGAKPAEAR
jgi:hypothetical protein